MAHNSADRNDANIGNSLGNKGANQAEENEDLRVRRTRKLIMQAFIELTIEKGFSTITVQDIADRAMVNRSTFYRHYLDKYDLLNKYMDEVYALSSEEELLALKLRPQPDKVPTGLLALLNHIQKNAEFYQVMLGPKGDPLFVQRLRTNTQQRFTNLLAMLPDNPDPTVPPKELRVQYISYAGVGAIKWWIDHRDICTAEQMAGWLGQLSSASLGLTFPEYLRRANTIIAAEDASRPVPTVAPPVTGGPDKEGDAGVPR